MCDMSFFLVLGSHPALSLAEAQAVYPANDWRLVGNAALAHTLTLPATECVERLGGTVKAGRIFLEITPAQDLPAAIAELIRTHPRARKAIFALTVFGAKKPDSRLPLEVKRLLQEEGSPARWFADPDGLVSPAAVKKAGLIKDGFDVCVFVEPTRISIGFTEAVQDPDAWTLRDMGRPWRDTENGMLPPKLARLLVNLAGGEIAGHTLLDPFCGSGTIPMEAALIGYPTIVGSDIDPQQVKDTEGNMRWLADRGLIKHEALAQMRYFVSAAAFVQTRVRPPVHAIVTEGFLGTPLKGNEPLAMLEREAAAITKIWNEALPTFGRLQEKGGVLVGVWPILNSSTGQARVDASAAAEAAGYTIVSAPTLIYARPEQHVWRRIVVLHKRT